MTTEVDETDLRISEHIRRERTARGWSLADLAARAGVSKAAISKIERREASPTATVLVRLAGAFDLTLAGLLLRAEGVRPLLVRAGDQPVWHDPETGYRRTQVFARPDHPVEIVEVALPPGTRVVLPASSYAHIRQAVRVLAGRLTLVEGGTRQSLEAGDCLGFGAPSEVTFANEAPDPCTYLVVLSRS